MFRNLTALSAHFPLIFLMVLSSKMLMIISENSPAIPCQGSLHFINAMGSLVLRVSSWITLSSFIPVCSHHAALELRGWEEVRALPGTWEWRGYTVRGRSHLRKKPTLAVSVAHLAEGSPGCGADVFILGW